MLNYIKSEIYRVTHTKDIFIMTGIMAGLAVFMNIILFAYNQVEKNFPYGTVRFSLNIMTSAVTIVMVAGAAVVGILYAADKPYGTVKNPIAYGISRRSIFLGRCAVSSITAVISFIAILVPYIGSAYLLLKDSEMKPLEELLKGSGAVLLNAFAALILAVALYQIFSKGYVAMTVWFAIVVFIPQILFVAGLRIEILREVAKWLPWNLFSREVHVTMYTYQCLWNTSYGLMRCFVSGAAGIIIFLIFGILSSKKTEF